MSIIAWIIFGGLAGWIASMITGDNERQGVFGNIIVGIIGAFVGGLIAGALGLGGVSGFNLGSFIIALAGSVIVLYIYGLVRHKSHHA